MYILITYKKKNDKKNQHLILILSTLASTWCLLTFNMASTYLQHGVYLPSTWPLLTFNMASTYLQHGHVIYLPSTWRLLIFNIASTYLCNHYEFLLSLCKIVRSSVILLFPLFTLYTIRFLFCHVLTGYMIINSSSNLILDYLSIYHSKQSVTRHRYFPLVLTYRLNNSCPCFINMYSEAQGEAQGEAKDNKYSKAVSFRELYIYICNQAVSDFFRAYHSNLFESDCF
jgi:hypothetical protein